MNKSLVAVVIFILLCNVTQAHNLDSNDIRFQNLARQIKCLSCQGQSILDTDSEFAMSVKSYIAQEIAKNASDEEIKAMLVNYYGSEILFDPPLTSKTFILWFLPGFLFIFMIIALLVKFR